jgi:hypothetical protein
MQTLVSLALAQRTERDPAILPILHKALDGGRLDFDEIVALLKSPDLLSMGMAANEIRFRLHPEPHRHLCRLPQHQLHQCFAWTTAVFAPSTDRLGTVKVMSCRWKSFCRRCRKPLSWERRKF